MLFRFPTKHCFSGSSQASPICPLTTDLTLITFNEQIPVAVRFKVRVCGRSVVGNMGSNPAGGMNV